VSELDRTRDRRTRRTAVLDLARRLLAEGTRARRAREAAQQVEEAKAVLRAHGVRVEPG